MGKKEDVEALLKVKEVEPIEGQPTDRALTKLRKELTKIAASIPIALGGGKHGHTGVIIPRVKYVTFSHNAEEFNITYHPRELPTKCLGQP